MIVALVFGSAVVLVIGLVVGALHGRVLRVAGPALAVALALWIGTFGAIAADTAGAGSFLDCRSSCTVFQHGVAVGFLAGPLLVAISAAGVAVGVVLRRRRVPPAVDRSGLAG